MDEKPPHDPGAPANHPGSRYGTAPEDRPDLAPEVEPRVRGGRMLGSPDHLPGSLPENRGDDPADVDRRPRRSSR